MNNERWMNNLLMEGSDREEQADREIMCERKREEQKDREIMCDRKRERERESERRRDGQTQGQLVDPFRTYRDCVSHWALLVEQGDNISYLIHSHPHAL